MDTFITSAVFSDNPITMLNHDHDCHQLIYIANGSADFLVGKKHYHATPGSIAIFSRLEQHSVTHTSYDYKRYIIQIRPFTSTEIAHQYKLYSLLFNRPDGFSNILNLNECHDDIQTILGHMVYEAGGSAALRNDMLNLLLQELLIQIYRQEPLAFSSQHEDRFDIVARIQSLFEAEYHKTFNLSQLASDHGLSTSYLSHIFKEISGTSIMGYLQSCRITAAKKYLADTTLTINEIVERCGFSDCSNFSRAFKKAVGCSPSQFRQAYSNADAKHY